MYLPSRWKQALTNHLCNVREAALPWIRSDKEESLNACYYLGREKTHSTHPLRRSVDDKHETQQLSTTNCFKQQHNPQSYMHFYQQKEGLGAQNPLTSPSPEQGRILAEVLGTAQTSALLPPGHNGLNLSLSMMGRWPQNHARFWPGRE